MKGLAPDDFGGGSQPPVQGRGFDRATLIAHARNSIAKGSKSFALASRLFPRDTRERAWLLYAWCRKCDDLADGQDHGGAMSQVVDPQQRLIHIRRLTDNALAGESTGDPAFDGLGLVAVECRIPSRLIHDVIGGFALDAEGWRPQSEEDLLRYCYHVAGAVGCTMALIMGVAPENEATLDRACDLGLAFQLANIARDVEEDHAVGRCYIPSDWLAEQGIPPSQLLLPGHRQKLVVLARRLRDFSARYEASARHGASALPFRSAWAVLAAAGIYGGIARNVVAKGEHAWDNRLQTGKARKLGWVLKAALQAAVRERLWPGNRPREGLWTRPHGGFGPASFNPALISPALVRSAA